MSLVNRQVRILLLVFCVLSWDHLSSQAQDNQPGDGIDMGYLKLASNPDNVSVTINDSLSPKTTPLTLTLTPGAYRLQATKEGYEPLSHALNLAAGQRMSAQFILKSLPPDPVTAESLGLMYLPEEIPIDVKEAERTGQVYKRLAETFAIIPLVHGILARFIVDKDDQRRADILIVSGAVLSGGSLILGKILSNKRRRDIEKDNARKAEDNIVIREQNRIVEQQVQKTNEEILQTWFQENEDRGRVVIDEVPP